MIRIRIKRVWIRNTGFHKSPEEAAFPRVWKTANVTPAHLQEGPKIRPRQLKASFTDYCAMQAIGIITYQTMNSIRY